MAKKGTADQEQQKTLSTSQTLGSWPSIFCEKDANKWWDATSFAVGVFGATGRGKKPGERAYLPS
ncbi:hypothetical protein [Pseudomonas sp. NPDC090201]|uniref:hypothetical protein n=1 Tax=Pseudomonas sp. NPDC090201 TaxID=3364475 RepID=UPI00382AAF09